MVKYSRSKPLLSERRKMTLCQHIEALEVPDMLGGLSKIEENFDREDRSGNGSSFCLNSTSSANSWSVSPEARVYLHKSSNEINRSADEILLKGKSNLDNLQVGAAKNNELK